MARLKARQEEGAWRVTYPNAGKEKTTAALGMALRGIGHVVITGRGATDVLIEKADLVTEMKQVKHPLRIGIKAQAGVEF